MMQSGSQITLNKFELTSKLKKIFLYQKILISFSLRNSQNDSIFTNFHKRYNFVFFCLDYVQRLHLGNKSTSSRFFFFQIFYKKTHLFLNTLPCLLMLRFLYKGTCCCELAAYKFLRDIRTVCFLIMRCIIP